jgi:hypothetical protein
LSTLPYSPALFVIQAEETLEVSLKGLQLPSRGPPHTELLDLDPLPLEALGKQQYIQLYRGRFTHFNPIQTQVRLVQGSKANCHQMFFGIPMDFENLCFLIMPVSMFQVVCCQSVHCMHNVRQLPEAA